MRCLPHCRHRYTLLWPSSSASRSPQERDAVENPECGTGCEAPRGSLFVCHCRSSRHWQRNPGPEELELLRSIALSPLLAKNKVNPQTTLELKFNRNNKLPVSQHRHAFSEQSKSTCLTGNCKSLPKTESFQCLSRA